MESSAIFAQCSPPAVVFFARKYHKNRCENKTQVQFRVSKGPKLEFQHMPTKKSYHPAQRETHALPTTTTTHFNGSDGQRHGKSKVFKDGCWKKEYQLTNSMIFVDLRVSTICGVFSGKLGLESIYIRLRGNLRGSPHFNGVNGQKYRNSKSFQEWLLEKAFPGKFDDFRRLGL